MVTQEQFNRSKEIIKAGWPNDKIVEEAENKLVLQCDNGAYLIYRRMVLSPELMDNPQVVAMMHEKVLFQFTEDLNDSPYNNVSMEIAGKREAEGRVKEALKELAMRVQLGNVLI